MHTRSFATAVAALTVLIGASTPSRADFWQSTINAIDAFAPGRSEVLFVGPAPDYSSPGWYARWLTQQNPSGAALYNQPCIASNGYRQTVVSCQALAVSQMANTLAAAYASGDEGHIYMDPGYAPGPRLYRRHAHYLYRHPAGMPRRYSMGLVRKY
jgi:hypothetical protein